MERQQNRPAAVLAPLLLLVPAGIVMIPATGDPTQHTAWYAARAAGMLAYTLSTGAIIVGLANATRSGSRALGQGNIYDAHRALALLAVLAMGLHVIFLATDQYVRFSAADLLIPFVAPYRPLWTGLGIVGAYLIVAVYTSFFLRSRIGYRAWRAIHFLTFGIFLLATVHGLMAGTDSRTVWATWTYALGAVGVGVLTVYRVVRGTGARPQWLWASTSFNRSVGRTLLAGVTVFATTALTLWALRAASSSVQAASTPPSLAGTAVSDQGARARPASPRQPFRSEQSEPHERSRGRFDEDDD